MVGRAAAPVRVIVYRSWVVGGVRIHAPGVTRTPGQRCRKPLRYPPELQGPREEDSRRGGERKPISVAAFPDSASIYGLSRRDVQAARFVAETSRRTTYRIDAAYFTGA